MAVKDGAADLPDTLAALAAQSFTDYELIAIDDGSTDDTAAILAAHAARDPRIRVVRQANAGLTISLNRGLAMAGGALIARQDVDDPSRSDRLERQVAAFTAEPDLALLGGDAEIVFPDGTRTRWGYIGEDKIAHVVLRQAPFSHGSVMFRADMARALGGYDETYRTSQDLEFWMRFAKNGRIAMLPDILIERRLSAQSISARRRWRQFHDALRARWRHQPGRRLSLLAFSIASVIHGLLPVALRLRLRRRG